MTRALWGFVGCFAFLASMAQAEDIVLPTEAPAPPPFPGIPGIQEFPELICLAGPAGRQAPLTN